MNAVGSDILAHACPCFYLRARTQESVCSRARLRTRRTSDWSGVSAAVGSCRYDCSGDRVAGDVLLGAVYESVVMATQQDLVVEFGFATASVDSLTELFVPHNCCGSSEVEWVAVGINDETSDGASRKKFTPDIDERDVVVVADEFVETNHDRGRVDGAPGFRSPVSSRAAEEAGCEVGEGICCAFGECAPDWGVVGVRVAELVERFAHNGGLVGGETAGEHGFDEQVAVLVEGFLSTFCSYFCEFVEMPDGCFTRRVVRPASEAGRLATGRSQPANRGQFRWMRLRPLDRIPPRSS
jgi:hypothetical protein